MGVEMKHAILAEFDSLIADAPLDFLGTGESSRHAAKEEREWHERVATLRKKIEDLLPAAPDNEKAKQFMDFLRTGGRYS